MVIRNSNRRWAVIALALCVSVTPAGAALAQSAGAKAAQVRHEKFEQMGATFKRLNDELRKGEPSRAVVTSSTQTLRTLAGELPTWFPRGSGVEARPASEAKAEIWSDAAGFSAASSALQVQAGRLHQLALAGDMDAVRGQVKATGAACGSCHKKYRLEKD